MAPSVISVQIKLFEQEAGTDELDFKVVKIYKGPHVIIREGVKKSKWKFKMAFAIRRPTPPRPLMAKFPDIFLPHFFSFAIESYIYETDFTLQKYHF